MHREGSASSVAADPASRRCATPLATKSDTPLIAAGGTSSRLAKAPEFHALSHGGLGDFESDDRIAEIERGRLREKRAATTAVRRSGRRSKSRRVRRGTLPEAAANTLRASAATTYVSAGSRIRARARHHAARLDTTLVTAAVASMSSTPSDRSADAVAGSTRRTSTSGADRTPRQPRERRRRRRN